MKVSANCTKLVRLKKSQKKRDKNLLCFNLSGFSLFRKNAKLYCKEIMMHIFMENDFSTIVLLEKKGLVNVYNLFRSYFLFYFFKTLKTLKNQDIFGLMITVTLQIITLFSCSAIYSIRHIFSQCHFNFHFNQFQIFLFSSVFFLSWQ